MDPIRFGKYLLESKLGEGGMGEVWKARDERLRRWVALKLLKNTSPEELARFEREARTAAGINHPNIAGIYESGEAEGRPYIAMQFVDGVRLDQASRDVRKIAGYVRDAARAVHAAHLAGVIHRDLKPANILIEAEGGRVFVTDFGLAKEIAVDSSLSGSGTVVGTAAYMAPEQVLGKTVDARCDVYSLGVTLYELLAGKPPFEGETPVDLFLKSLSEDPPPLRIALDFETIVMKCLEKDPARRYATAQDLAEDLARFVDGEPIVARRQTTAGRLWRKVKKKRVAVIAALAAVVAVAAIVGAGHAMKVRTAREKYRQAEAEPDPTRRLSLYLEAASHVPEAVPRADALRRRMDAERRQTGEYRLGLDAWERAARLTAMGDVAGARSLAETARSHFERANGLLETAAAWHLIGLCRYVEEQLDDAWAAWERALAVDPAYDPARLELAKSILVRAARLRSTPQFDASDRGLILVAWPPESEEVRGLRERAERLLAIREPSDRAVFDGLLAFTRGEHLRSAEQLLPYARRERWDIWVQVLLGFAYFGARDFERAESVFTDLLRFGPNYNFYLGRGLARHGLGKIREAVEDYTAGLVERPESLMLFLARAGAYWHLGDLELAEKDYTVAVGLDPDFGAYARRGEIRLKRRSLEGAIEDLLKALSFQESGRCRALLGQAYRLAGKWELARPHLDRSLELSPANVAAWLDRASVRYQLLDYEGAISDFNEAIRLDPGAPLPYANRALAWEKLGDRVRARADFRTALEIAPKDWEHRAAVERSLARVK